MICDMILLLHHLACVRIRNISEGVISFFFTLMRAIQGEEMYAAAVTQLSHSV